MRRTSGRSPCSRTRRQIPRAPARAGRAWRARQAERGPAPAIHAAEPANGEQRMRLRMAMRAGQSIGAPVAVATPTPVAAGAALPRRPSPPAKQRPPEARPTTPEDSLQRSGVRAVGSGARRSRRGKPRPARVGWRSSTACVHPVPHCPRQQGKERWRMLRLGWHSDWRRGRQPHPAHRPATPLASTVPPAARAPPLLPASGRWESMVAMAPERLAAPVARLWAGLHP